MRRSPFAGRRRRSPRAWDGAQPPSTDRGRGHNRRTRRRRAHDGARPVEGAPAGGIVRAASRRVLELSARRWSRQSSGAQSLTSCRDARSHPTGSAHVHQRNRHPPDRPRRAARRRIRRRSRARHDADEPSRSSITWRGEWIPQNGARVVARAWTDPAFRARLLANGRAAVAELGLAMPQAPPPPRRAGEHAEGAERHLLHAVLVHGVHDHRPAAGLVQGSRVPRRASCASRAPCCRRWASTCRRRSRSASGTRPPTRVTWCCRSGRRTPSAGRRSKLADIVTRDAMIGVARL